MVFTPLFNDKRTFVPAGTVYDVLFDGASPEPVPAAAVVTGGVWDPGCVGCPVKVSGTAKRVLHVKQAAG